MNDYISILKKDLLDVIDNLVKKNIVNQDFKKDNLTIDYLSKSKQGDVSTNLFILFLELSPSTEIICCFNRVVSSGLTPVTLVIDCNAFILASISASSL